MSNIAKKITKIRDWQVTDPQFQRLNGFLVTVWIQKSPFIYLFFGSSVFNIHETDILVLTSLLYMERKQSTAKPVRLGSWVSTHM